MVDGWAAELRDLRRRATSRSRMPSRWTSSRVVVTRMRQAHDLRLWEMEAIDQYGGPQALVGDLARLQRVDTPERLERLLARLAAYPAWMDAHRANVEAGLAAGRTAAAPVVERCITQTRRMLETPAEQSPIVLGQRIARRGRPGRTRGGRRAATSDRRTRPGWPCWSAMPATSVPATASATWPTARSSIGITSSPGRRWTRTPVPSTSTGSSAWPRSRPRSGASRRSSSGTISASCVASWTAAPDNHARSPGSWSVSPRRSSLGPRPQAGRWFGRLPSDGCEVRAVEPHMEQEAPPAFYVPPSEDGSRRGVYYINTFDPASRPLHRLPATTFHEAVPGHHFQIAIEQELHDLPTFRRFGSRLAGGAYVEGWALYAERLAVEMGLYDDPRERFGALESEGWRAARLVVDTGIHALGWTRGQSIELLRERAGLSRLEAETETDRYISWPGQALSYMIGQREILALRAELERRDGERFDLRAFHDEIIGHGSLPLSTLRAQLPAWVKPRGD